MSSRFPSAMASEDVKKITTIENPTHFILGYVRIFPPSGKDFQVQARRCHEAGCARRIPITFGGECTFHAEPALASQICASARCVVMFSARPEAMCSKRRRVAGLSATEIRRSDGILAPDCRHLTEFRQCHQNCMTSNRDCSREFSSLTMWEWIGSPA